MSDLGSVPLIPLLFCSSEMRGVARGRDRVFPHSHSGFDELAEDEAARRPCSAPGLFLRNKAFFLLALIRFHFWRANNPITHFPPGTESRDRDKWWRGENTDGEQRKIENAPAVSTVGTVVGRCPFSFDFTRLFSRFLGLKASYVCLIINSFIWEFHRVYFERNRRLEMMPSEASDHPRTVLYKTLCIFMKILTKLSESNQPRKTRIYRILEHVTFDTGNEIPEIKLELRGLQIRLNCASMTDRYANK